jgi:hypothetical protein
MTTIVTNPVTLGAGVPDATTIEPDLKFLIIQTIASTLTFQEAPLALVKSNLLAGALVAANNLSDLANAVTARGNIGARNFYYSSGTTAPSGTSGIIGDTAINDSGIIYEKTAATTWTIRLDIMTAAELTALGLISQATADTRYAPLGESPGSGARYLFDVSTAIGSIGTGEIRFNNTVSASITSIAIYETDRNGGAMATFLDLISIGSKLQVSFDVSEEIYSWFNVTGITDNGAFRTFTVTHIASAGTRANGEVTLGIFGSAGSSLTVREVDGTPSIAASVIEFPNGSLTDQGGGVARLTLASGGASGIQYTYNDADPPTASGQIRTLQASLNVATAVAINAADSNGDGATDITARLKTGAIFTIAKDASNYVRFEATADYASGSVSVVMRADQGTILTGDTVYLAIASDAVSTSGGGGLAYTEFTASAALTEGQGAIANSSSAINFTLPAGLAANQPIEVTGKGTGIWAVLGGTFLTAAGVSNTGLRRLATHQYASARIKAIAPGAWVIQNPSDMTGLELFTDNAGFSPEANAAIAAVEATGVILTPTQKTAANTLMGVLLNNNWAGLAGVYLYLGGTAASHAVNWRNPGTNTITWSGTVTHNANGILGNGSTGYGNTGIQLTSAMQNSNAAATYVTSASSGGYLGSNRVGQGVSIKFGPANAVSTQSFANVDQTTGSGLTFESLLVTRTASSGYTLIRNGTTYNSATGVATSNAVTISSTTNFLVLAVESNGGPSLYSNAQIGLSAVWSTGLTVSEGTAVSNAIKAFAVALGR